MFGKLKHALPILLFKVIIFSIPTISMTVYPKYMHDCNYQCVFYDHSDFKTIFPRFLGFFPACHIYSYID